MWLPQLWHHTSAYRKHVKRRPHNLSFLESFKLCNNWNTRELVERTATTLPVTRQGPQTHPESVESKYLNNSRLIHFRFAPMNVNFVNGIINLNSPITKRVTWAKRTNHRNEVKMIESSTNDKLDWYWNKNYHQVKLKIPIIYSTRIFHGIQNSSRPCLWPVTV